MIISRRCIQSAHLQSLIGLKCSCEIGLCEIRSLARYNGFHVRDLHSLRGYAILSKPHQFLFEQYLDGRPHGILVLLGWVLILVLLS